ncbi:MAG: M42 family metallopeptidase [Ruminococcaceae bacterium]|nr:M42 family metallopeptidase [Oscillospiraceae bacterium]
MLDMLKQLCLIDGISGDEATVRNFIISQIKSFCEYKVDNLGNIICFKKGEKTPKRKIMLDAHTDEVGLIISSITESGYLKFKTVGGIDTAALLLRRVLINGKVNGVIGGKPFHLLDADSRKKLPKKDDLYIDIGAKNRQEAEQLVSLGDSAVIISDFEILGDCVKSKALDDRIGCLVLIKLLKEYNNYDFYVTFTVQEEVGLRGAKTAAFAVKPDFAIALDSTTAADIAETPKESSVCVQGKGVAVSFMDNATMYDKNLYNAALNSGILCQPKSAVAGGNNAGSIHLSGEGVRTIALSAPCRYIHTANSIVNIKDIESMYELTKYMLDNIANENIK